MDKEELEYSLVETGEETYQKAWKEGGGKCQRSRHQTLFKASWATFIVADSRNQEQGYSFTDQCETTGKEDEDESRSKKSSQVSLLLRKYTTRAHLQVLREAKRGGDD